MAQIQSADRIAGIIQLLIGPQEVLCPLEAIQSKADHIGLKLLFDHVQQIPLLIEDQKAFIAQIMNIPFPQIQVQTCHKIPLGSLFLWHPDMVVHILNYNSTSYISLLNCLIDRIRRTGCLGGQRHHFNGVFLPQFIQNDAVRVKSIDVFLKQHCQDSIKALRTDAGHAPFDQQFAVRMPGNVQGLAINELPAAAGDNECSHSGAPFQILCRRSMTS